MKFYVEIPCDNIKLISKGLLDFILTTDLLNKPLDPFSPWHFIDCKAVLTAVPELLAFFKDKKLVPRHAAVTIITDDGQLPKHVDEPPVVAKINFPVINTNGWVNRWYDGDKVVAELHDMKLPIVFNSQIPHSVEKTSEVEIPRIVASFTFHNEPLDMLA